MKVVVTGFGIAVFGSVLVALLIACIVAIAVAASRAPSRSVAKQLAATAEQAAEQEQQVMGRAGTTVRPGPATLFVKKLNGMSGRGTIENEFELAMIRELAVIAVKQAMQEQSGGEISENELQQLNIELNDLKVGDSVDKLYVILFRWEMSLPPLVKS